MASRKPRLPVKVPPEVQAQLAQIWLWNAGRYSAKHANAYLSGLRAAMKRLERDYDRGRRGTKSASLRYIVYQWRPRRHGHVVIYEVVNGVVEIVGIYHTAENWHSQYFS